MDRVNFIDWSIRQRFRSPGRGTRGHPEMIWAGPREPFAGVVVAAVLLLSCALVDPSCSADWTLLTPRGFDDPWLAAPREAQLNALALAWADPVPFVVTSGRRHVWDIDVGESIPIASLESRIDGPNGRVPTGGWGISFSIPVDFHMMEDLQDPSGPILNTDYRFGGSLRAQVGLPSGVSVPLLAPRAESSYLFARVTGGHESTHLGDEYSLRAAQEHPTTFERINVSYQWIDASAGLLTVAATQQFRFRAGVIANVLPRRGYYNWEVKDFTISPIGPVTPGHDRDEAYSDFEFRRDAFSESNPASLRARYGWYAGLDVRWRAIYNYHRQSADTPEQREASFNAVLGLAPRKSAHPGLVRVSPYVRWYYGVNPHGQFRNQPHFHIFGLGLHVEH